MDHSGGIEVNEGIQLTDFKTKIVSSIEDEFVVKKPFIFYIFDCINHIPILVGRIVNQSLLEELLIPIVLIVMQNSSGQ
jgi:hypothetical protein